MGPGQQPTTGGRGPQPQPSSRNDAGMYGLAAELTQTGQLQQPARPAPTSRVSQPVQLPPMQPRMPAGSGLQQQAAMAPFGLAPELLSQQQLQRGRLPPEDDNQPYGLVAELQGAAGSNPLAIRPAAGDPHMTATARRHQAAARRALGNQMAQMSSQQPSALKPPPIGVSDLEPDYGLVAELKGNVASDPLSQRQAFGLAAEVERRRARPDPALAARSSLVGGVPGHARQRKRLAGPADFTLAKQLGAQQAAEAKGDPFDVANLASKADPFVMADNTLKFPTAPYVPSQPIDQEIPEGPVPLKVPPSGASRTSRVGRDSGEYGLAADLGVDPEEARRQRLLAQQPPPPPHNGPILGYDADGAVIPGIQPPPEPDTQGRGLEYVYNPTTGMVIGPDGHEGEVGGVITEYMETPEGDFVKLGQKGWWKRFTDWILRRNKKKSDPDDEEPQEGEEGWDPDKGKFRGKLRSTVGALAGIFSTLGIFAQGLLGGFALLNFFMTYLMYSGNNLRNWLKYYAPLALANNRMYYTLLTMAIVASTARLARDQIRGFAPRKSGLQLVDWIQLILYIVAYILCVLMTPLDDELTYEWGRNPRFYDLTFTSGFKSRLNAWLGMNVIRTVCAGIGWLLCAYQSSTLVLDGAVRREVQVQLARRLQRRKFPSPALIMGDSGLGGGGGGVGGGGGSARGGDGSSGGTDAAAAKPGDRYRVGHKQPGTGPGAGDPKQPGTTAGTTKGAGVRASSAGVITGRVGTRDAPAAGAWAGAGAGGDRVDTLKDQAGLQAGGGVIDLGAGPPPPPTHLNPQQQQQQPIDAIRPAAGGHPGASAPAAPSQGVAAAASAAWGGAGGGLPAGSAAAMPSGSGMQSATSAPSAGGPESTGGATATGLIGVGASMGGGRPPAASQGWAGGGVSGSANVGAARLPATTDEIQPL